MNYITHLNAVFNQMDQDTALTAQDISLYIALFRRWNKNFLKNPIVVVRDELMKMAKIGSVNTYGRCLKRLHKFGYINYIPSYDPNKGSQIHLLTFDKGGEQVVRPLINNINKTNYTQIGKNKNQLNDDNMEINKSSGYGLDIPPSEIHIKIYFDEKGYPPIEADKFFNYYESNGWLVGGKTKMKDWKAAARNWIINKERFDKQNKPHWGKSTAKKNSDIKLGQTDLKRDKNYGTPL